MTQKTIPSRFRLGVAATEDWRMAVDACLMQMMPVGNDANIGFLYATEPLARHLPAMARRLSEATGVTALIGASSHSIIGGDTEYLGRPALACLIGGVPEDSAQLFTSATERPQGWFGIIHADPHVPALPELIEDFGEATHAYLVGGLVAQAQPSPLWAGGQVNGGLGGAIFSAEQPIVTGLTQGCVQVGAEFTVTAADGTLVIELDQRPAYDRLKEAFGIRTMQELRRMGDGLMIGLPLGGSDRPDYTVRNIMGIDAQTGVLAVGAMLEEGDRLFFCRRDPESAGLDMDRMLADIKRRCQGVAPRGAVYFSCVARSQDHLVQEPGELARIQAAFPDLPVVGMYCGGEIAKGRLYGYTGVLSLFL